MPLNDADLAKIRAIVDSSVANRDIGRYPNGKTLHAWEAWKDAALKAVDVNQLAAAIVGKLPPAATGGLSKGDVEEAVRAVFADASTP